MYNSLHIKTSDYDRNDQADPGFLGTYKYDLGTLYYEMCRFSIDNTNEKNITK